MGIRPLDTFDHMKIAYKKKRKSTKRGRRTRKGGPRLGETEGRCRYWIRGAPGKGSALRLCVWQYELAYTIISVDDSNCGTLGLFHCNWTGHTTLSWCSSCSIGRMVSLVGQLQYRKKDITNGYPWLSSIWIINDWRDLVYCLWDDTSGGGESDSFLLQILARRFSIGAGRGGIYQNWFILATYFVFWELAYPHRDGESAVYAAAFIFLTRNRTHNG
jgi:hypothetical protein